MTALMHILISFPADGLYSECLRDGISHCKIDGEGGVMFADVQVYSREFSVIDYLLFSYNILFF